MNYNRFEELPYQKFLNPYIPKISNEAFLNYNALQIGRSFKLSVVEF